MPNPKLRLREQFHEVARFKHFSLRTEGAYWDWVVRFLKFHRGKLGGEKAETLKSEILKAESGNGGWRHPREAESGKREGAAATELAPKAIRSVAKATGFAPASKRFVPKASQFSIKAKGFAAMSTRVAAKAKRFGSKAFQAAAKASGVAS